MALENSFAITDSQSNTEVFGWISLHSILNERPELRNKLKSFLHFTESTDNGDRNGNGDQSTDRIRAFDGDDFNLFLSRFKGCSRIFNVLLPFNKDVLNINVETEGTFLSSMLQKIADSTLERHIFPEEKVHIEAKGKASELKKSTNNGRLCDAVGSENFDDWADLDSGSPVSQTRIEFDCRLFLEFWIDFLSDSVSNFKEAYLQVLPFVVLEYLNKLDATIWTETFQKVLCSSNNFRKFYSPALVISDRYVKLASAVQSEDGKLGDLATDNKKSRTKTPFIYHDPRSVFQNESLEKSFYDPCYVFLVLKNHLKHRLSSFKLDEQQEAFYLYLDFLLYSILSDTEAGVTDEDTQKFFLCNANKNITNIVDAMVRDCRGLFTTFREDLTETLSRIKPSSGSTDVKSMTACWERNHGNFKRVFSQQTLTTSEKEFNELKNVCKSIYTKKPPYSWVSVPVTVTPLPDILATTVKSNVSEYFAKTLLFDFINRVFNYDSSDSRISEFVLMKFENRVHFLDFQASVAVLLQQEPALGFCDTRKSVFTAETSYMKEILFMTSSVVLHKSLLALLRNVNMAYMIRGTRKIGSTVPLFHWFMLMMSAKQTALSCSNPVLEEKLYDINRRQAILGICSLMSAFRSLQSTILDVNDSLFYVYEILPYVIARWEDIGTIMDSVLHSYHGLNDSEGKDTCENSIFSTVLGLFFVRTPHHMKLSAFQLLKKIVSTPEMSSAFPHLSSFVNIYSVNLEIVSKDSGCDYVTLELEKGDRLEFLWKEECCPKNLCYGCKNGLLCNRNCMPWVDLYFLCMHRDVSSADAKQLLLSITCDISFVKKGRQQPTKQQDLISMHLKQYTERFTALAAPSEQPFCFIMPQGMKTVDLIFSAFLQALETSNYKSISDLHRNRLGSFLFEPTFAGMDNDNCFEQYRKLTVHADCSSNSIEKLYYHTDSFFIMDSLKREQGSPALHLSHYFSVFTRYRERFELAYYNAGKARPMTTTFPTSLQSSFVQKRRFMQVVFRNENSLNNNAAYQTSVKITQESLAVQSGTALDLKRKKRTYTEFVTQSGHDLRERQYQMEKELAASLQPRKKRKLNIRERNKHNGSYSNRCNYPGPIDSEDIRDAIFRTESFSKPQQQNKYSPNKKNDDFHYDRNLEEGQIPTKSLAKTPSMKQSEQRSHQFYESQSNKTHFSNGFNNRVPHHQYSSKQYRQHPRYFAAASYEHREFASDNSSVDGQNGVISQQEQFKQSMLSRFSDAAPVVPMKPGDLISEKTVFVPPEARAPCFPVSVQTRPEARLPGSGSNNQSRNDSRQFGRDSDRSGKSRFQPGYNHYSHRNSHNDHNNHSNNGYRPKSFNKPKQQHQWNKQH